MVNHGFLFLVLLLCTVAQAGSGPSRMAPTTNVAQKPSEDMLESYARKELWELEEYEFGHEFGYIQKKIVRDSGVILENYDDDKEIDEAIKALLNDPNFEARFPKDGSWRCDPALESKFPKDGSWLQVPAGEVNIDQKVAYARVKVHVTSAWNRNVDNDELMTHWLFIVLHSDGIEKQQVEKVVKEARWIVKLQNAMTSKRICAVAKLLDDRKNQNPRYESFKSLLESEDRRIVQKWRKEMEHAKWNDVVFDDIQILRMLLKFATPTPEDFIKALEDAIPSHNIILFNLLMEDDGAIGILDKVEDKKKYNEVIVISKNRKSWKGYSVIWADILNPIRTSLPCTVRERYHLP